jgi:hypothetical protein
MTLKGPLVKGLLAVGIAACALFACSLTLPSKDSYFGADTGADVASGGGDSAVQPDGAAPDAVAETGAGGDTSVQDAGGADALDAANQPETTPPFDAATLPLAVLQVYYPFDTLVDAGGPPDAGVVTTPDQSGNQHDGVLASNGGTSLPVLENGHVGHALLLDGTQKQYVSLPNGIVSTFESMSVACWINLTTAVAWNRLFDFNAGQSVWIYFSPTGWNFNTNGVGTHFAISSGTHLDPEMQLTQTVPPGSWHHVAIVLSKPWLFYYLDGLEQFRTATMTLSPSDLGTTTANWLGRSAYTTDPYLSAALDEFRLYSGGLTPSQVLQLASQ